MAKFTTNISSSHMKKKSKEEAVDTSNFLSSIAKSALDKKSKAKTVSVSDDIADVVDDVCRLKKKLSDAKASCESAEEKLIDAIRPKYEDGAKRNDFMKSISVRGNDSNKVMVSWSDSFSAIPMEHSSFLKRADEDFDKHFIEKRVLTVKSERTNDESIQELLELLGQKKFKEFFDVGITVATKAGMDQAQFGLEDEIRQLLKQRSPSVKLSS